MRDLIFGEKRKIGMLVKRKSREDFEIEDASYSVRDNQGRLLDFDDASVDGHQVYMLFDTTKTDDDEKELYRVNKIYKVYFTVRVAGLEKVIINYVQIRIVR